MFHVGQKVRCAVNGDGVVVAVDAERPYPVAVRYDDGDKDYFTEDGRVWVSEPVVLFPVDDENKHPSPDSMSKILELISEGWEMLIHWGDHTSWTDVPSPSWEVDFTRRKENGLYDNHESGYSNNINEAISVAYNNIRNGIRLNRVNRS